MNRAWIYCGLVAIVLAFLLGLSVRRPAPAPEIRIVPGPRDTIRVDSIVVKRFAVFRPVRGDSPVVPNGFGVGQPAGPVPDSVAQVEVDSMMDDGARIKVTTTAKLIIPPVFMVIEYAGAPDTTKTISIPVSALGHAWTTDGLIFTIGGILGAVLVAVLSK
jgi:hypothetical protein